MAVEYTIEELKHLYANFKKHDKDKNRKLSRGELLRLVQEEVGTATEADVEWLLNMIDIRVHNKDAVVIKFPQYVRGMSEFAKTGIKIQFAARSNLGKLIESGMLTLSLTGKRGLTWMEVDRVYKQFERADENDSGTISAGEMAAVLKKVTPNLPETAYSETFAKIDKNQSGFVDFIEFLEWVTVNKVDIDLGGKPVKNTSSKGLHRSHRTQIIVETKSLHRLKSSNYSLRQATPPVATTKSLRADAFKAYAAMDCNADGELDEEEFSRAIREVLGDIPKSEQNRLYYLVDSDQSGTITFDEFLWAVAHKMEVSKIASTMKHSYFPSKWEWEIPFAELEFETKIGEGNFGIVYKGKWHGTPVAIKQLKQQTLTEDILEDFKKEVTILAKLRHPNIVLFMGACTQPNHLCIVTEFLSEGNVYQLLHKRNKRLAPGGVHRIAGQVARGLNYLHKQGIVHRDLKSLNLLLDDNNNCKLCDFGLSCLKPKKAEEMLKEQVGSPLWMAPELLHNKPYNEKVDIYAFATCIWECLTNKLPFDELSFSELVYAVTMLHKRPDIPIHCNLELAALLQSCWDGTPSKRPSADEIVKVLDRVIASP